MIVGLTVNSLHLKENCLMAFADPQTVTIATVANTLPRTSSGPNSGAFKKDDGLIQMNVSHSTARARTRHLLRIDHSKIAADPLQAGINVKASMAVYIVVDVPDTGYTIAEQKQVVDGLTAYLTASSGARATQLLGGEN